MENSLKNFGKEAGKQEKIVRITLFSYCKFLSSDGIGKYFEFRGALKFMVCYKYAPKSTPWTWSFHKNCMSFVSSSCTRTNVKRSFCIMVWLGTIIIRCKVRYRPGSLISMIMSGKYHIYPIFNKGFFQAWQDVCSVFYLNNLVNLGLKY